MSEVSLDVRVRSTQSTGMSGEADGLTLHSSFRTCRYSDLFSVACAVGVQLLRPGLATETLADDWAVAVGNTWSAVVDRLDAKSGTVVGRSRHATMLIAALDLLNRGAQLVAHSSVSAARNGFGDVAM